MAIDKKLIDQLLTDYKNPEDIIGKNGLLKQLTKAVLERALEAEMTVKTRENWSSTLIFSVERRGSNTHVS